MLVRWTQPAADDLLHICDYTAERFGAAQARRVADAIYESAASLHEMPNRGRPGRKPNTREMIISGLPFVIIYRVGQEAVEVALSCTLRSNGPKLGLAENSPRSYEESPMDVKGHLERMFSLGRIG